MKSMIANITMNWLQEETRQIAVNLKPGITVLTGPSGGGKTSFARALLGLDTPISGHISHNSQQIYKSDDAIDMPVAERNFAAVSQQPALFPTMTVRQNIMFGARMEKQALRELIKALELDDLMDSRAQHLSGGQAARVAIARSLASMPAFMVLDEPTAGLDRHRRGRFIHLLRKVLANWNIPVLYITHHTDEILSLADHVLLMDDGKLISQGALEAFFQQPEAFKHLGIDDAGVVVSGRVRDSSDDLIEVEIGEGVRMLLSNHGEAVGDRLRLRVLEADIAIARKRIDNISVLNQLPGRITDMTDIRGNISVEMTLGSADDSPRLRARVTKNSTVRLKLEPGMKVWALIKAVAIRTYD